MALLPGSCVEIHRYMGFFPYYRLIFWSQISHKTFYVHLLIQDDFFPHPVVPRSIWPAQKQMTKKKTHDCNKIQEHKEKTNRQKLVNDKFNYKQYKYIDFKNLPNQIASRILTLFDILTYRDLVPKFWFSRDQVPRGQKHYLGPQTRKEGILSS